MTVGILDCGGKRSATPLSSERKVSNFRKALARLNQFNALTFGAT